MKLVVPDLRLRAYFGTGLQILGVTAVYYAGGQIAALEGVGQGQVRLLWPPPGIGLAALLLFGYKIWPGITVGSFLVSVSLGRPFVPAAAISVGVTLALLLAYLVLRRLGFRIELDRLRDAIALVFLAAFAVMALHATIRSGVLVLAGLEPASNFGSTWFLNWMGTAMGVLVVTPFLLLLRRVRPRERPRPLRALEAVALLAGTALVMLIAIRSTTQLLFLAFPFLIWAAVRFQLAGAAPCVIIVAGATIYGASQGSGPFAGYSFASVVTTVQAFNGAATLTALILSASISERVRIHREMEYACLQTSAAIEKLNQRLLARPMPAIPSNDEAAEPPTSLAEPAVRPNEPQNRPR